jgi:RHS repeat-associated protein
VRYDGLLGAQQTLSSGQVTATQYSHGDMIGSTVMTASGGGAATATFAYTAFGEVVTSSGGIGGTNPSGTPRYQYAGAHGYETGSIANAPSPLNDPALLSISGPDTELPPIVLQHLGARWYDPGIGRFIQRDRIGITGGLNVYAYVSNSPLDYVDPDGLTWLGRDDDIVFHDEWHRRRDPDWPTPRATPPTGPKQKVNWEFAVHAFSLGPPAIVGAAIADIVCTIFIGWVPGSGYSPGDCLRGLSDACKRCW